MKVAIVYRSSHGATKAMAKAIRNGVAQHVASVDMFDDNSALDRLDQYNGIIFGSPTYMGTVSADFKRFMDKSSYKCALVALMVIRLIH
jgi:NAD(P)H dehydrogenase (quinone)